MKVLAIVVLVIAGVLVFAATRPSTFEVARSTRINATPDKIFPLIDDFHQWNAWSPYEHRDPAMKKTFAGAPTGQGAVYTWDGNRDVGRGRMEITQAVPGKKVAIALDFYEPFEGHNNAEFTLVPEGSATQVTWAMRGPLAFVPKVMGLFVSMDSMIGNDFSAGLAKLKSAAEK